MSMYSLTKFVQIYSCIPAVFSECAQEFVESTPASSEQCKCTWTKPLLRLRSYRPVFKNVAEAAISTVDNRLSAHWAVLGGDRKD